MSRRRFDVAVIGGGPAGCAAALAAARENASVLLLEREARLGGNVTNGHVHTICGLFEIAADSRADDAPVWLQGGLARSLAETLVARGGALPPERAGRVFVVPIAPIAFGSFVEASVFGSGEVDVHTRAELISADLSGDEAELGTANGSLYRARTVIDASGDAVLAAHTRATADIAPPAELQACSFIVALEDVDPAATEGFARLKMTRALSGAARRGDLPRDCESVLVRPGLTPGAAYLTLNLPKTPSAVLGTDARAAATRVGKEFATQVIAHLRETREGFARARVAAWPVHVGVRETRRLRGRTRIAESDVLEGRRRDDDVALSAWPIELWEDHRRARFAYPSAPCGVPLGALVSETFPRLGMAGRCLSASHVAHGALRVIGTALATGEAIGVAAALAAKEDVSLGEIAPATIRSRIEAASRG